MISSFDNINYVELSTLNIDTFPIDKIDDIPVINKLTNTGRWNYNTPPSSLKLEYNTFIATIFDDINPCVITFENNYSIPFV